MRTLALLALCGALAGISSTGCKKSEAKKEERGRATGPGDFAPAPPRESAKSDGGEKMAKGEKGATDKGAERRWDKPASREAKAAEAMVASRRPKDQTPPPKAQLDLPEGGLLTAGSFDDNLFPGPLRTFLKKINRDQSSQDLPSRFLGHRMVVTVTNGDGRPVGNARVQVRPADGGPSVTLCTRTDGRAVFLSSWDEVPADGDLTVTVTAPGGTPPVEKTVARNVSRCEVKVPGSAAPLPVHLDLALVIDTTGSMGDELEYLKTEFRSIVAAIHKQFPNVRQRYALVLYRDEGDEYVTRTFDFTDSLDDFRERLGAQRAAGGGDTPEAMHQALEDAVKLDWREGDAARVLFLVADAPPHARHALKTLKAADVLRKKGAAIYPVAASGYDDACEFVMRASALLTGAQFLFLTDDSGVGNAHGEPHIPFYQVERLNHLMVRMIASELSGRRIEPDPARVVRTVGKPVVAENR
ncbi:MAG: VWA domain-containing protein [Gemmataceae bacterium]|nr:VWA domain-containing protein [Gemmataceae bacterium]